MRRLHVAISHLGDDEGFHLTHDGQPYSVVEALADPSGARMIEGPSPGDGAARVDYVQGANGFALVRVVEGALLETFYDEAGAVRYESRTPR
jgi:hypothetical protein